MHINIPMFLAFRRCAIFSTMVIFLATKKTNFEIKQFICTISVCIGALLASWEHLESNWFGIALVWLNNITQSLSNIYVEKLKQKGINVFGKFVITV